MSTLAIVRGDAEAPESAKDADPLNHDELERLVCHAARWSLPD